MPKGLNNLGGILLALLLVGIVASDVSRDVRRLISARTVSLFTIFCWFVLEAIQVPEDLTRDHSQAEYDFAAILVGVAIVCFVIGYHTSRSRVFDGFARRLPHLDSQELVWRLFAIGATIGFLPLLVISGFDIYEIVSSAFSQKARWSGSFGRGRYGNLQSAFLELQMFLSAVVPLAVVILFDRRASRLRRIICALFTIWMVSRNLLDGTRSKILPVVLPILVIGYLKMSAPRQRLTLLIGVPILCVAGYIWSAASVVTRNSGEFSLAAAEQADYVGFEMFRELVYLSRNVPDRLDYQLGKTYLVQVANPIPRALWPSKPVGDAGLLLAAARGAVDPETGEPTMTISPGLLGEMYWNFGLVGVAGLSALWGWLARCWDRLPLVTGGSVMSYVIYCSGLAIIFANGRSFSMPSLYGLLSFAVLLYLITSRLPVSGGPTAIPGVLVPRRQT